MRAHLALLAAAALLTGCVAAPDANPTETASTAEASLGGTAQVQAMLAGHACEASDVGEETTSNLVPLDNLKFGEGVNGEADVRGDLMLVAREQLGGFYVVDVSDPTAMRLVSTFEMEKTTALDVKWLPDGRGALIGAYAKLILVDLADPAAPVLRTVLSYQQAGLPEGQAHMVNVHHIGEHDWVFVATQVDQQPVYVFQLDGWELTYKSSYEPTPVVTSAPLGPHDITIVEDRMLGGKPVMYVAEGLTGWSAVDVSDPANPKRLGGALNPPTSPGYLHTVRVDFMGGKRIVATMMEVGVNTLTLWDATDLSMPVPLAQWQADRTKPTQPQHNIQLHGGYLYMAHYVNGFYVFNVTKAIEAPAPMAGTLDLAPMAHWAAPTQEDGGPLGFANLWDLLLVEGVLYANEMQAGLHSVAFACLTPGDPEATATE